MSASTLASRPSALWPRRRNDLVVALGALAALYVPVYLHLFNTLWQADEYAHGPMILVMSLWLAWREKETLAAQLIPPGEKVPALAWGLLLLGLLSYILGISQNVSMFEVGSQMPVFAATIVLLCGWRGLRTLWFPLLFIFFMIPLPASVVDAMTNPLKQSVSALAEHILYAFDYPIARTGVLLTVGQYQLLVADACSGLHSMFSLSALGLLYMKLVGRPSRVHNLVLAACIIPIAFTANVLRVLILVLVTYHFGDEAGQGFIHGAAGIVLFVMALGLLMVLDTVFNTIGRLRSSQRTRAI